MEKQYCSSKASGRLAFTESHPNVGLEGATGSAELKRLAVARALAVLSPGAASLSGVWLHLGAIATEDNALKAAKTEGSKTPGSEAWCCTACTGHGQSIPLCQQPGTTAVTAGVQILVGYSGCKVQ